MQEPQLDALYEGVCDTLPFHLRRPARDLPYWLKLTPLPGTPWSEVFNNEVTLAAPTLFAEAFGKVGTRAMRSATLAHMLAVIEAFGTDRIEDGQIEATQEVSEILGELRKVRDRCLVNLTRDRVSTGTVLARTKTADEASVQAIRAERALLESGAPISLRTYEQVSLGKQAVGFPATLLLAEAQGWDARRLRCLEGTLASIWLALQYEDDVVDWEDDYERGAAWALSLARGLRRHRPSSRQSEPSLVHSMVLWSGVLERMLRLARRRYRAVRRRAEVLGAPRLVSWADQRLARLEGLILGESRDPGYAVRVRKLAPWACEVLA